MALAPAMEGASASAIASECAIDHRADNDDSHSKYVIQTRQWTERIPIGLGLCPWAGKSLRSGGLQINACNAHEAADVGPFVLEAARQLCESSSPSKEWTTTLVVCPHVSGWRDDFARFDAHVQTFKDAAHSGDVRDVLNQLTLVAFHPNFTRWHALPPSIGVGSLVRCHRGMCGFEKSKDAHLAKIIKTDGTNFGGRKNNFCRSTGWCRIVMAIHWQRERHFPTMPCIERRIPQSI